MEDGAVEYRLSKVLGKGTYGTAYLAFPSHAPDAKCVVKKISLEGMSKKDVNASVVEAKLLQEFQHPYVLGHIDHWISEDDNLFLVTELADGGDLQQHVKAAKKAGELLPESTIWSWIVQLCLSIKHVHDRKVLHRDIKSANIFLTRSKRGGYDIKLGDFGISKVLEHTQAKAKTAVGTPYYMSPELCSNQPYDCKSDVWAIGCVAYELCTLRQPFDALNFNALCMKILKGKYAPIASHYSQDLHDLVRVLLQLRPEKRPTINQLLEMKFMAKRLEEFKQSHPTVAQSELSHTVLHGFKALSQGRPLRVVDPSHEEQTTTKAPGAPAAKGPQSKTDSMRTAPGGSSKDLEELSDFSSGSEEDAIASRLSLNDREQAAARGEKFTFAGRTLALGDNEHSTHEKAERLRLFLEQGLGATLFLKIYRMLDAVVEETDEHRLEQELVDIVGWDKIEYLNTCCQLIYCEDRIRDNEHPAATVTAQ